MQCVAVCCSVQEKGDGMRVCYSVLKCIAVCCTMTQYVAVKKKARVYVLFCSVLPCVATCCSVLQCVAVYCCVLLCNAFPKRRWYSCCFVACCSILQRVAEFCSVLLCVAVCCSVL